MTSELTSQVVAYQEVPDFNSDVCVDWALEMMELGYESEALYTLAGLSKPAFYFETIKYLKEALKDLSISIKVGEEAIVSYSSYFIKRMSGGENVKENLTQVFRYCSAHYYKGYLYDFYFLWWAWDDLDYGNEHQYYWPGADRSNIEKVVIMQAKKWLAENRLRPFE